MCINIRFDTQKTVSRIPHCDAKKTNLNDDVLFAAPVQTRITLDMFYWESTSTSAYEDVDEACAQRITREVSFNHQCNSFALTMALEGCWTPRMIESASSRPEDPTNFEIYSSVDSIISISVEGIQQPRKFPLKLLLGLHFAWVYGRQLQVGQKTERRSLS